MPSPGKRGFSNEVGRWQEIFLRCWPPADTRVQRFVFCSRWDRWPALCSPHRLGFRAAASLRCCPPTISSVTTDHDELCELPSRYGSLYDKDGKGTTLVVPINP